jgi:hypothetical protein
VGGALPLRGGRRDPSRQKREKIITCS